MEVVAAQEWTVPSAPTVECGAFILLRVLDVWLQDGWGGLLECSGARRLKETLAAIPEADAPARTLLIAAFERMEDAAGPSPFAVTPPLLAYGILLTETGQYPCAVDVLETLAGALEPYEALDPEVGLVVDGAFDSRLIWMVHFHLERARRELRRGGNPQPLPLRSPMVARPGLRVRKK